MTWKSSSVVFRKIGSTWFQVATVTAVMDDRYGWAQVWVIGSEEPFGVHMTADEFVRELCSDRPRSSTEGAP